MNVKKVEKKRKRSPLLPVFGLILAIGLYIAAYALVEPLRQVANKPAGGGFTLPDPKYFDFTGPKPVIPSLPRLGVAFAIWLVFLGLAYSLVAILVGRDPNSAKNNPPLPPRDPKGRGRR